MQAPLARLGLDGAKKRLTIHCFNSQDTGVDWREVPFKSKRTWGGLEESLFRSHKQHPRRDLTVAPLPSLLLLLPKPKKKIHQFQIYNTCTSKTVKPFDSLGIEIFLFSCNHMRLTGQRKDPRQRCLASWLRLSEYIHKMVERRDSNICTLITAALLITAKSWKQSECPLTDNE